MDRLTSCRAAAIGLSLCAPLYAPFAGGSGAQAAPAAPHYSLVGTYVAPGGAWDVLPDGRLITLDGNDVFVQDGLNASSYTKVGSVPSGLVNFSASFLSVSPSGSLLAFGDNNFGAGSNPSVYILSAASLDPGAPSAVSSVSAANFNAAWTDDATLFVSGADGFGSPSVVTRIDASNLASLTASVAISNIDGSSGGVATDGIHLFAANGYDNGPGGSSTGTIKAFALADLAGPALDFESGGIEIGDVLSGSPLGFDGFGNLLVGGGDFDSGDFGYAGVVAQAAVGDALAGGALIPGASVRQLVPGGAFDFYSARANRATGEVLVTFYGDANVYRYGVPGPGASLVLGAGGLLGLRRRRRAC